MTLNRATIFKLLLTLLAILWLFAAVSSYYIVHKPFTVANALALLNVAGDIFVAGALIALAAALGRRALRGIQFATPLEEIVFHTGIGLGVVSFATFAFGLLGWLSPIMFWAILVVGLILLRNDLRAMGRAIRSIHLPCETHFEQWLARFCVFALVIAFFFALAPPTGWDGIQYHLVGPQDAIRQGRIIAPRDNVSLNYPGLIEMLFLAAMILKGDSAAQLMNWIYLPLLLGLVLEFARRFFTWRVGWLAAALLVATPGLLITATWAYNDVALAFYATGALYLVLRARDQDNDWRGFILPGIFAGLAMGEKYTAAFIVLALIGLIATPRRAIASRLMIFCLCAGVVAMPWYARNWIFMGNPVYPFVWGGPYWDAFRADWYSRPGTGLLKEPLRLLLAPWDATVLGSEQGVLYQATISPLLLALLPLGLFTRHAALLTPRPTRALWWFTGALYAVWLYGVAQSAALSQTRLLFPAFPALALLAGEFVDRLVALDLPQLSVRRFAMLVIGVVLSLTAFSYGLSAIQSQTMAYMVGAVSRGEYLAGALGEFYTVTEWVNRETVPQARILFLWETRPYYFRRAVLEDPLLDRWAHLRFRFGSADAIARYLRAEGYNHILLNRAGLDNILQAQFDPISAEDIRVLQELLTQYSKQVYGAEPLELEQREGKPGVFAMATDAYAVYELLNPK